MEKKTIKGSDLSELKKIRSLEVEVEEVEDKMIMEDDARRLKALPVNGLMSVKNLIRMLENMPKDSKVSSLIIDTMRGRNLVVIQSKDFTMLTEGEEIPVIKFDTDKSGKITSAFKESADFFDALKDL